MKNEMSVHQMKVEMLADKDVRGFIEALQEWYDRKVDLEGVSNKKVSELAMMDPSVVSRLVNGRNTNPGLKTLAKVFRAMNLRLLPEVQEVSEVSKSPRNFSHSHVYDEEVWRLSISASQAPAACDVHEFYQAIGESSEGGGVRRGVRKPGVAFKNPVTRAENVA